MADTVAVHHVYLLFVLEPHHAYTKWNFYTFINTITLSDGNLNN